ncbi:MAG: CU044_5270 family protein [Gaiellaceae bacterium]
MPTDERMITELRLAFDEATRELDPDPDLLTTLRRRQTRQRRRRRLTLVVVSATLAATLALAGTSFRGHHAGGGAAYAATPPVLNYTPSDNVPSAHDLLLQLASKAAAQPQPAAGRYDYIETRGWSLDSTDNAGGPRTVTLNTIHHQLWVTDDGSGRTVENRAGRIYDDVVPNDNFPNGLQSRTQLPTDPSVLRAELAKNYPNYGTFEWFTAVGDVWNVQVVTPQVQAALLRVLAGEPDMVYSGTVTDRAGRTGVATSTESDHSGALTRYTLIFDPSTGALLDSEETALEAPRLLRLRVPATTGYELWLKTGRVDSTDATP